MKGTKKYFKNRVDTIILLLKKLKHSSRPTLFHQLRIEIKKLDAFFDLINYCSKDFRQSTSFTPFKEIFSQAGKVRELQIERQVMKKHFFLNALREYRKDLNKQLQKEIKLFYSMINKSFISKLKDVYFEILPFLKDINETRLNRFLNKKRKVIRDLLVQKKLQPGQMHELRIHLKAYYYIAGNRSLQRNTSSTAKDVLTPVLGKWHDAQMMIKHLEKAIVAVDQSQKNVNRLKKIKAHTLAGSDRLLAKVDRAIPASEFLKPIRNP